MIDKIISALESMQEDMEEHGELQKARGVSSAIWLIEFMKDFADRKTEPQQVTSKLADAVIPTDIERGAWDYKGNGKWEKCKDEPQTDCAWK